jgi:hypothetical protein
VLASPALIALSAACAAVRNVSDMTMTGPLATDFFAMAGPEAATTAAMTNSPDFSMECRSLTMSAVPL